MPVSKRRPHVSEILNIAVEHKKKFKEAAIEILQRPAQIWFTRKVFPDADMNDPRASQNIPQPDEVSTSLLSLEYIMSRIPDKGIVFSRACEKVSLSVYAKYVRSALLPVGFVVLAYTAQRFEAASTDHGGVWLALDTIVNVVYLVQSLLRIGGTVIRYKIDRAFNRQVDSGELLRKSGLLAVLVTAVCVGVQLDSEVGQWLRLVRLSFIAGTVLEIFPHIDVLMSGISSGIRATLFTVLMLYLLILFYASLGHTFFRKNDPAYFGSYALACLSFFQMTTFENWSTIWFTNYSGCDAYTSVYTGAGASRKIITSFGVFLTPSCDQPSAQPGLATLMFVSFSIFGGYICVNMALAAVTIGVSERLDELRSVELFGLEEEESVALTNRKVDPAGDSVKAVKMMGGVSQKGRLQEYVKLIAKVWDLSVEDTASQRERKRASVGCMIITLRAWEKTRAFAMVSSLLLLGDAFTQMAAISGATLPSAEVHMFFTALLTFKVGLSALVTEPSPRQFLLSFWNALDVVSLALLWPPTVAPAIRTIAFLHSLRVLRLSLILRHLTFISSLDIIIKALASSFVSLLYVLFIMLIFFYYYAVASILLFRHADPYHFGTFQDAFRTLLQVMTLDNWTRIMRTCMYGCRNFGYDNGLPQYDSLCSRDGVGVGWWAPLFFVAFVTNSAMVLVSLLIGVIISSMELLKEEFRDNDDIWSRMDSIQESYMLTNTNVERLLFLFEHIDSNGNGYLTFHELKDMFATFKMNDDTQFEFFMRVDRDSSGQIDFCEFCEMMTLIQRAATASLSPAPQIQTAMKKKRTSVAKPGGKDDPDETSMFEEMKRNQMKKRNQTAPSDSNMQKSLSPSVEHEDYRDLEESIPSVRRVPSVGGLDRLEYEGAASQRKLVARRRQSIAVDLSVVPLSS